MAKLFNRVKVATATPGTGPITLGAAAAGFQTLAQAGAVTGDLVPYFIEDGSAWEAGEGVYDAAGPTLTRVLIESSTGSMLDLSGSATMYVSLQADMLPIFSHVDAKLALKNLPDLQRSGRQIMPFGETEGQFANVTSNTAYFAPFTLSIGADINALTVRGTTTAGATGQQVDIALYRCCPLRLAVLGDPIFVSGPISNNVQDAYLTVLMDPVLTMPAWTYFIAYNVNVSQRALHRANRATSRSVMGQFALEAPNFPALGSNPTNKTQTLAAPFGTWPTFTGDPSEDILFTPNSNETVPAFALRTV